ncbi:MAG: Ig-like domain-containing protein [Myxococcota bacterium]|nr:Ig-like domain-containing protein [Myxococcota bacterium]
MKTWLLPLLAALTLGGCFNFDQDYADCFDAGLCDGDPPELLNSSPAPLATAVPLNPSFTLVFSEPMDLQSTSASLDLGVGLANPVWDEGDQRLTLTPLSELALNTSYVLTVQGRDQAGNALNNAQISFTTRGPLDTVPPSLTSHSPAEGATSVAWTHKLNLIFSERMDPSSLTVTIDPPYELGEPSWTVDDTRVDFLAPPQPLAQGTAYSVTLSAKDLAQNLLIDDVTFAFHTQEAPDSTPPTLVSSTPADESTAVPLAQTLAFIFSEGMDPSTVSTLVTFSPSVPSYALTWYNEGTLLEVNPAADLAGSTSYTVTLNSTLKDASGNAFAGGAISFSTAAAADTTPPTLLSTVPAQNAAGVLRSTNVTLNFSEPMDRALTQAAFSVFNPARTGAFSWNAASTQLTFNPDSDLPLYTQVQWQLSATAKDQAGNAISYTAGTFRTVRQATVSIESDPAADGYLSGSSTANTTGLQLYAGDSNTDLEYQGYLHFPLDTVHANLVRITGAYLYVYQASLVGTPYGKLYAESVDYGETLTTADFNTPTLKLCERGICTLFSEPATYLLSTSSTIGWKSAVVTSALQGDWDERGKRGLDSQFRLTFPTLPNGDGGFDYAGFYTGNNTTSRPYLSLTYEYP